MSIESRRHVHNPVHHSADAALPFQQRFLFREANSRRLIVELRVSSLVLWRIGHGHRGRPHRTHLRFLTAADLRGADRRGGESLPCGWGAVGRLTSAYNCRTQPYMSPCLEDGKDYQMCRLLAPCTSLVLAAAATPMDRAQAEERPKTVAEMGIMQGSPPTRLIDMSRWDKGPDSPRYPWRVG